MYREDLEKMRLASRRENYCHYEVRAPGLCTREPAPTSAVCSHWRTRQGLVRPRRRWSLDLQQQLPQTAAAAAVSRAAACVSANCPYTASASSSYVTSFLLSPPLIVCRLEA